jgi:uncharacterized protein with von Willebrand factor type A (vWA) domain
MTRDPAVASRPAESVPGDGLSAAATRLCRALRRRGLPVTPAESIDACRALALVDLGDRNEVSLALRSVLVSRMEDFPVFEEEFDRVFAPPLPPGAMGGLLRRPSARRRPEPPGTQPPPVSLERWMRGADQEGEGGKDDEPVGIPRQSERETLGTRDFSQFDADHLDEITRLARQIARRLARRPSRRWKAATRGERLALRRTIRLSLRTGGDPLELAFRTRKPRRARLIAICDVSGSMDLYSRFLLQVLYAVQRSFARVETFVFSTRLTRITEQLAGGDYRSALDRLSRDVTGWSGGTRIGECLARVVELQGRRIDRRTIVMILSDGWDTGDPRVLADALAFMHRRAGRVVWLNPLLGSPDYKPLTGGMQAALPHIDVFAPAHNVDSLRALARHLAL